VLFVVVVRNPEVVLLEAARDDRSGTRHHGGHLLLWLVQANNIAPVTSATGGGVCPHIWNTSLLQLYVFQVIPACFVILQQNIN
jgi:hypothetical protein